MRGSRLLQFTLIALAVTTGVLCDASEEDASLVIGPRRDPVAKKPAAPVAPKVSENKKSWFKAGLSESAFHSEALAAARALGSGTATPYDADDLKEAVVREKTGCTKEFLWMLNWKNVPDALTRRGAIAGLAICNPDGKAIGKPLTLSAIFEPDTTARKASIELVKARKDPQSGRTLIETWKSAFDDQGALAPNETVRKAAVDAMHEIRDKRVFQAMIYYATLELRAQSGAPVRVDQVNITGQGINLPIDLPVIDIISAEGTIAVPAMSSLKQATGQDFGHNFGKWAEWLAKQP